MDRKALLEAARAFRDDDPDPRTRAEAADLIAAAEGGGDPRAWVELEERFGSELAFGTAGLRGLLGAGSNRMNRRVVARTTAALCAYLARRYPDAKQRGICLGFDGRHQSRELADEVAAVAWGAGFVVHRFDEVAPTPLVAFSVLARAAVSGVVVTASHNPAEYNGYKVYLADGAQLGTPADEQIQAEREKVSSALVLPRLTAAAAKAAGLARPMDGVEEAYVAKVAAAVTAGRTRAGLQSGLAETPAVQARGPLNLGGSQTEAGPSRGGLDVAPLRAAYTAMHGVGAALAQRVFAAAGFLDVQSVAEQNKPDPDFPTVAFPNPEEPGALDHVLALGESSGADIAIANDPDADRLALAARARSSMATGEATPFSSADTPRGHAGAPGPQAHADRERPSGDRARASPVSGSRGRSDGAAHPGAREPANIPAVRSPEVDGLVPAAGSRPAAPSGNMTRPPAERARGIHRVGPLAALSGNEVGVLLADHLLSLAPRDGLSFVVSTIVSTPLLERVCRDHGAICVRTLTGFKWIIGKALALSHERGLRFVLGFEEALGYCIGDIVRDKDGIAAAAHALAMAERHAAAGRTLHDALEALYRRHGLCQSSQVSFTRPGSSGIAEIRNAMAKLRANPPSALAGIPIVAQLDLAAPVSSRVAPPTGTLFDASDLAPSDVVAFELEGAHRITVRPSGTEPKLKLYLDVWGKLESATDLSAARAKANGLAAQLATATAAALGF